MIKEVRIDINYINDQPNLTKKMSQYIASAILGLLDNGDNNDDGNVWTHLDSHANMIVCGKYCWVFVNSNLKADVTVFSY